MLDRVPSDFPVRGIPDSLAVAQHESLRRFVTHAGARLHSARKLTRTLHDEKRDVASILRHLLIRGTADGTRRAVFEDDHRLAVRKLEKLLQRISIRERDESCPLLSPLCTHPVEPPQAAAFP